jgi:hypothetical protein
VKTPVLRLVPLSVATMRALVAGDLAAASAASGITATPYLADHAWLWNIRLPQVAADPAALGWIARAAVTPRGTWSDWSASTGRPTTAGWW